MNEDILLMANMVITETTSKDTTFEEDNCNKLPETSNETKRFQSKTVCQITVEDEIQSHHDSQRATKTSSRNQPKFVKKRNRIPRSAVVSSQKQQVQQQPILVVSENQHVPCEPILIHHLAHQSMAPMSHEHASIQPFAHTSYGHSPQQAMVVESEKQHIPQLPMVASFQTQHAPLQFIADTSYNQLVPNTGIAAMLHNQFIACEHISPGPLDFYVPNQNIAAVSHNYHVPHQIISDASCFEHTPSQHVLPGFYNQLAPQHPFPVAYHEVCAPQQIAQTASNKRASEDASHHQQVPRKSVRYVEPKGNIPRFTTKPPPAHQQPRPQHYESLPPRSDQHRTVYPPDAVNYNRIYQHFSASPMTFHYENEQSRVRFATTADDVSDSDDVTVVYQQMSYPGDNLVIDLTINKEQAKNMMNSNGYGSDD